MVTWDRNRVESYAQQILTSLIANPMASEELIAIGLDRSEEDQSSRISDWSERWANIAFDVAEVFAAEADQRDQDTDCRLLDDD